jgi:hypothetical protein
MEREAVAEVRSVGVGASAFNATRSHLMSCNCEDVMSHVTVLGVLDDTCESVAGSDEDGIVASHFRRSRDACWDDDLMSDEPDLGVDDAFSDEDADLASVEVFRMRLEVPGRNSVRLAVTHFLVAWKEVPLREAPAAMRSWMNLKCGASGVLALAGMMAGVG